MIPHSKKSAAPQRGSGTGKQLWGQSKRLSSISATKKRFEERSAAPHNRRALNRQNLGLHKRRIP